MSSSDLNNIKDTGTLDEEHHIHDPDYYFHDGSVVFLADDVLFKIHASRFSPHSSNEAFNLLPTTSPTDPVNVATQSKGSSDFDPILLPEFEAEQFRNFLYLFYGSPIEPKFKKILEGVPFTSSPKIAKYYMDVAIVSHHLGMDKTQSWALRWLTQILDSSGCFEYSNWTSSQLLQALRYAKLMNERALENNIRAMLVTHSLYRFSPRPEALYLVPSNYVPHAYPRELLDVLYRNLALPLEDRPLFGQILCVVLHAGHKSLIWTKELTRNERATLFAVQVCLTPLPKSLDCSWLESPVWINKAEGGVVTCSDTCKHRFEHAWKLVFNKEACEQFRQTTPLASIDALCNLIIRRSHFHAKLSSPTKIQAYDEKRVVCAKCKADLLKKLDSEINQVFSRLVDLFEQVERDGYAG